MNGLVISAIGFILLVLFLIIFHFVGNNINPIRKIGKYIAYSTFVFLIIIGLVNYLNEKPFIQKISGINSDFFITFPSKPIQYDVAEGVNGLKSLINGEEFYFIYTNVADDNSIEEISENFDKIIEEQNLQVTYKKIGEKDSLYFVNPLDADYFVYKKFVVYDGMFLDFNVKSKNQFPNDSAKVFLEYEIHEKEILEK